MNTSNLATKLGTAFITETITNYEADVVGINNVVKAIEALSNIAQRAVLLVGKSRAHLHNFTKYQRAHIELNSKTWNVITEKLKSIGCTNAGRELQNLNYKETFHKDPITVERVLEVLAQLNGDDESQNKAKATHDALKQFTDENFEFTPSCKLKGANTEIGLQTLKSLIEIIYEGWNAYAKPKVHLSKYSKEDIAEQVNKALSAIKAHTHMKFSGIFEVKGYANGNIDLKMNASIATELNQLVQ